MLRLNAPTADLRASHANAITADNELEGGENSGRRPQSPCIREGPARGFAAIRVIRLPSGGKPSDAKLQPSFFAGLI